ncbi:MAG: metalloprotease [Bacteroidetes bacterium]|nr:metalloprotease [Bacteroidota bacterium]
MSIKIYYDKIKFRIHKTGEIKKFLEKVIRDEKRVPGDLKFIFTDDVTLQDINKEFLKHEDYTDIISFDYSTRNVINGELYISAEALKRNAIIYKAGIKEELIRVMIHGVLHLCGYDDNSSRNRALMFSIQEKKLKEFQNFCV